MDKLKKIIDNFFFNTDPEKLGFTNLVQHKIKLTKSDPIKQRYYPVSPFKQENNNAELDKMIKLGVESYTIFILTLKIDISNLLVRF